MKTTPSAETIASAVAAYCEAMDVPAFDDARIAARHRELARTGARSQRKPRYAAVAVAIVALLAIVVLAGPAVVARVEQVLRGLTVSHGRSMPLTIREVDLAHARADMPFIVIAPPPIPSAPNLTIDEISNDASPADRSVVFEFHGPAPGREVMIVEQNAGPGSHGRTLLTLGADRAPSPPPSLEPRDARHREPSISLHGALDGRTFAPSTWVVRGTRIVLMSPPGFLTPAQVRSIRRTMSGDAP